MIKVIAASLAGLLLIPVLVIGAVAGGFGDVDGADANASLSVGELEAAVLAHPAIHLTPNARGDVSSGAIDPRVLRLLLVLAQSFELGPVGPLVSGHSYYVKGTTRVSNHMFGRAIDILGVNGVAVSVSNEAAREVMEAILALPDSLQPDELGGPWLLNNGRLWTFTKDHLDHIHAGWSS
ncbi:MAG: hypothetical protein WEB06_13310 [Actinomycetota bacterium]